MLDRSAFDRDISGTEDEPEEIDIPMLVTPLVAIQCAIFDLLRERVEWQDRPDPNNVLEWIEARIENLYQAQRELAELRQLKAALAVLRGAI